MLKRRPRFVVLALACSLAGLMAYSPSASAASETSGRKPISGLLVMLANPVTIVDLGDVLSAPPMNASTAETLLNQMCASEAGQEIRLESNDKIVKVGRARVLGRIGPDPAPIRVSNRSDDISGTLRAQGYAQYTATCTVGIMLRRVPPRAFYEFFIDDVKFGTYSYGELRAEGFDRIFFTTKRSCGADSIGREILNCSSA